jgi:ADP-heptose:LPS heptosyltransferase
LKAVKLHNKKPIQAFETKLMSSPEKTKKAIVFISAGLGDALLLIPMLRILQQSGFAVTALVTSPYPLEELLDTPELFDEVICIRNKLKLVLFAFRKYRLYQLAVVNYFAATRHNLLAAKKLATMVHTNRIPEQAGKSLQNGLVYFKPKSGIQDAQQNILLAGKGEIPLTEELFHLPLKSQKLPMLPEKFIVLQISAGNFIQKYKNWPLAHWMEFLKLCAVKFPDLIFVVLGDANEKKLGDELMATGIRNIHSLAGQTSIAEAAAVIERSSMFLGLDGGLLHIAVALGKHTFTLWGPSNPVLYGYDRINPTKHESLSLQLKCSPCSAWNDPNTSRFSGPDQCPDHKCLFDMSPAFVFEEFSTFVHAHALA